MNCILSVISVSQFNMSPNNLGSIVCHGVVADPVSRIPMVLDTLCLPDNTISSHYPTRCSECVPGRNGKQPGQPEDVIAGPQFGGGLIGQVDHDLEACYHFLQLLVDVGDELHVLHAAYAIVAVDFIRQHVCKLPSKRFWALSCLPFV